MTITLFFLWYVLSGFSKFWFINQLIWWFYWWTNNHFRLMLLMAKKSIDPVVVMPSQTLLTLRFGFEEQDDSPFPLSSTLLVSSSKFFNSSRPFPSSISSHCFSPAALVTRSSISIICAACNDTDWGGVFPLTNIESSSSKSLRCTSLHWIGCHSFPSCSSTVYWSKNWPQLIKDRLQLLNIPFADWSV